MPVKTAVVADVTFSTWPDSDAVWTAAELGNDLLRTIAQYPGQCAALDFNQNYGTIIHRYWAFWEFKARSDYSIVVLSHGDRPAVR
jgi:hypothetical protein